jgi:MFS family permease
MSLPHRSIVLIGLTALAVAMGVGRFAFTPMMPLMLRDATLDAGMGAEWAAANYVGYLVGALTAAWFARQPRLGLQLGLAGVAVSTLGMVFADMSHPWVGACLRGAAGVCSAWVLVCASSWCLPELARRQASALGGWIYTGVGVGIALTGVLAWLGGQQTALALWLELGALALVGATLVRWMLPSSSATSAPLGSNASTGPSQPLHPRHGSTLGLIGCYGAFGFGYIVPATFLPTMARQLVDDPLVFGLTWPLFGLAAAVSVAMASRWLSHWPRRQVWALAQTVMAAGTLIPLVHPSLWALACSAVLVGGTFMVATMAGLQLAREHMPANPTALLSRMTAAFALGQIAGPVLVRLMGSLDVAPARALNWANGLATLILIVTAAWLWRAQRPRVTDPA